MAYEQRDNSGTLFLNDKKCDNERAPGMKGRAMIGGQMYWVSCWKKEGAKGPFLSLSFELMEDQGGGGGGQQQRQGAGANFRHPPRQPNPKPTQPFGDEPAFKDSDLPF